MKKILKWVGIVFAILFIIGIIAAIFETDEQTAARELDTKNKEVAAEQVKAEKLQAKADKQAAKEAQKQAKIDEKVKEKDKISDISLYFDCKPKIQAQLKNPKSFDPKVLSLKYNFVDNQHIIGFDFYAKNSFGGEIMQQAICSFDVDGNILEYGII